MTTRRRFLAAGATGLLVAAAPAIVRSGVLMPIKPVAPLPFLGEWIDVRQDRYPGKDGRLVCETYLDGRLVNVKTTPAESPRFLRSASGFKLHNDPSSVAVFVGGGGGFTPAPGTRFSGSITKRLP